MTRIVIGLLLGSIVLSLAGCGGGGGSTPEAAFDKFKASIQKKDYETAMAQTTPDSQDMMLAGMVMVASFAAMDPTNADAGKDVKAILDKHGIKDSGPMGAAPPEGKSPFAEVKNKPACIGELMTLLEKKGSGGPSPATQLAEAKLEGVKVSGDTAEGTVKVKKDSGEESQPAKFKKVGDVWLIDFASAAGGPGAGGPPPGAGGAMPPVNLPTTPPDSK
jgi:hypothetical protein